MTGLIEVLHVTSLVSCFCSAMTTSLAVKWGMFIDITTDLVRYSVCRELLFGWRYIALKWGLCRQGHSVIHLLYRSWHFYKTLLRIRKWTQKEFVVCYIYSKTGVFFHCHNIASRQWNNRNIPPFDARRRAWQYDSWILRRNMNQNVYLVISGNIRNLFYCCNKS